MGHLRLARDPAALKGSGALMLGSRTRGSTVEATDRSRPHARRAVSRTYLLRPERQAAETAASARALQQEVARSSRAPPIVAASFQKRPAPDDCCFSRKAVVSSHTARTSALRPGRASGATVQTLSQPGEGGSGGAERSWAPLRSLGDGGRHGAQRVTGSIGGSRRSERDGVDGNAGLR